MPARCDRDRHTQAMLSETERVYGKAREQVNEEKRESALNALSVSAPSKTFHSTLPPRRSPLSTSYCSLSLQYNNNNNTTTKLATMWHYVITGIFLFPLIVTLVAVIVVVVVVSKDLRVSAENAIKLSHQITNTLLPDAWQPVKHHIPLPIQRIFDTKIKIKPWHCHLQKFIAFYCYGMVCSTRMYTDSNW